ncbi:hypothetical protein NDK47_24210 [Brevibacillus ruminantium]|uniref:Uncharacterized protein n=1 Tax=Brevibacillus ruminantium TaxID=2950604 RepID=A0ABY4WAQ3_9BACL|nr:hypothetical protein [Brevibacillus ruminantium]USG64014.1 hypothetical protein NDK47_17850 [Brevibacillus ruminantium]USG65191.1 hypothetical protein NDK47_24210 [Brevibacillus ruminantium]
MGCTNCANYHEESEYGDYGTCYGTWYECTAKPNMGNLKAFPFKTVPKSCRGVFKVDREKLTGGRGWEVMAELCDSICGRSEDHDLKYDKVNGCSLGTCEAFRYIEGRTDLWERDNPLGYMHVTEERIRDALKGKKLFFRDRKGRKHEFKVAIRETCPDCKGDSYKLERGIASWLCPTCNGSSVVLTAIASP